MRTKILVCGAGAVGGYFGGRLAQNPDNEVTFLSRGQTFRNLSRQGLIVKSIHGDFSIKINAVDDTGKLKPVFDYIFVCTKLYDSSELLRSIKHLFTEKTISVTLQNGLPGYEELKKYVKDRDNLLLGICKISSELKSDGVIYHTALGKILTGEYEGSGKAAAKKLNCLLNGSEIKSVIADNFKTDVWVKYAWNSIFNSLSALYMKSADELFRNENTKAQIFKLYDALREIAGYQGVQFGEREYKMIISDTMGLSNFYTSAFFDRRNGRKTEIPYFLSYLISLADEHGLKDNYLNEFVKLTEKFGL
ncbi:MAG: ketopantoate reductase family protein [Ignavibacteria bacterium]|jgi:2-dehydropantoate 2-reductase|nr:ketopantoate reductase family protein [Ignavibacteria bacterium]